MDLCSRASSQATPRREEGDNFETSAQCNEGDEGGDRYFLLRVEGNKMGESSHYYLVSFQTTESVVTECPLKLLPVSGKDD